MSSAIYFRVFGHALALGSHGANSMVMMMSLQNQTLIEDEHIQAMASLQGRYLTVWNVFFQIAYFSIAFICDIATVAKMGHRLPKGLSKFRQTFFSSLVFPITLLVVAVFWPFFLYDRSLIFPEFIDKVFSFNSNLVIHLAILFFALWELVFWPRSEPQSHKIGLGVLCATFIIYISLVFHTYSQNGLFPYPIFTLLYGTIYFPILLAVIFFIGILNYFIQWKLTAFIWGTKKEQKSKTRRKVK